MIQSYPCCIRELILSYENASINLLTCLSERRDSELHEQGISSPWILLKVLENNISHLTCTVCITQVLSVQP